MELSVVERDLRDNLIQNRSRRIMKFLTDQKKNFKHRLVAFLMTPSTCRNSYNSLPDFPLFEADYGKVNWKKDFPYLQRDQSVNLVTMINFLVTGNHAYFPSDWTDDMLFLFVKDCVDNAIHEFDYYW